MSADRPDPESFVDDRHAVEDPDPYGIVPEGFVERYDGASTIAEALRMAERETSKTDPDEFSRCPDPDCGSIRLRKKAGSVEMEHRKDTAMKCTSCGLHFDDPAPSREDCRPGTQATFREVNRR